MTWYADLGPLDYFRDHGDPSLRAVGWLGAGHPFPQGEVSPEAFQRLCELLVDPWEPAEFRGFHTCEFCPPHRIGVPFAEFIRMPVEKRKRVSSLPQIPVGSQIVKMGVSNLFVPGEECVYVAPSLIAHYIREHRYSPPPQFVEAVMRCPEPHSEEYLAARRTLPVDEFFKWLFQRRETRSPEYVEALRASGANELAERIPWWLSMFGCPDVPVHG